ncbi:MAG: EF2563 family selenium-dependent molybdenum hydroxylase system protein [Schwartzia sp.]|nr:EF2563 family selenium-dependent molybdenum hydroxylase system protein [Schwartzia sp. (in: firmicutes)]MBR1760614.1 EF2563 family selenium-dependent molybdenum hydroxylase system protein [Schwartzia sp. (in: firmicutes)]MBR1761724.1 EF2563 family selenium-dependent molybdenum hydroxylase system protein [Schwartzia sp. (in: firmicutes)]MBR1886153.1 EF2563 family selenium-dependent molybdenum hydroxylase system protein [Schwartzia sp. (in: firmicutes)]
MKHLVIVRGGGELGTAVAHRLHRVGYKVLILEKSRPSALRRELAFSDAVYDGEKTVERVTCVCAENLKTALSLIAEGRVTMLVDPTGRYVRKFPPHILVNTLDGKEDESRRELPADFRIGLGAGYCAREDVNCVVETVRGYSLGRIIYDGRCRRWQTAEDVIKDGGFLRAETDGAFKSPHTISHIFRPGDMVGEIYDDRGQTVPVVTSVGGVLRGIIHDNYHVPKGMAVAEIDPRMEPSDCSSISDKARCISGSVLEAIMAFESGVRP